ncbi:MAG TPA: sigma-70 family RNA polymerase sigma factor [Chitinophagales bacterium]|nr:sigma-70 family RNA polymerase sigma factor [Chitinophagales bacterium]
MTCVQLCRIFWLSKTAEFVNVFKLLLPNLIAIAKRYGINEEDAKDALQEALFKFFRKFCLSNNFETLCPEGDFLGYLFEMAKNILIDNWKKNSKSNSISLNSMLDIAIASIDEDDPINILIRNNFNEFLSDTINNLKSEVCKNYFTLILQELTNKDIDNKMGYAKGTARQQSHRCKNELMESILNSSDLDAFESMFPFIEKFIKQTKKYP